MASRMPKNRYSVGRIGTFSLRARTVKNPRHEVIEGPWGEDYDLPVVIEPGEYEAVCVNHSYTVMFDKPRVVMRFRITDASIGSNVVMDCYWPVQKSGKGRWTVRKASKLAQDIVRLFPGSVRSAKHIQGALKDLFRGKLCVVEISTVTKNYQQKPLDPGYSKVERIVKVY